jgi:hypothetical protein
VVLVAAVAATATPSPTTTVTPSPTAAPTPEPTPVETATPEPSAVATQVTVNTSRSAPASSSGIARITAPAMGINHYIEVVSVVGGQMQAPVDGVSAVGWYPAYSRPGQPGNAVFSAHETWNRQRGPFFYLHSSAAVGAEIAIDMTDGRRLTYEVISNRRYSLDEIPMGEVLYPSGRGPAEEWITLITCGGRIVYDASGWGEYLDRDVVVAKRVG